MIRCLLVGLLLFGNFGCSTVKNQSFFDGTYDCEGYVAESQSRHKVTLPPFLQSIEHKQVNGIDLLVVRRSDAKANEKTYASQPSDAQIYILDNEWRFFTFQASGELLAGKKKASFVSPDKNKITWMSEVPEYTTNAGKKIKPAKYSGSMWIDAKTGNKKSQASFVDKTLTCKRRSLKPLKIQ